MLFILYIEKMYFLCLENLFRIKFCFMFKYCELQAGNFAKRKRKLQFTRMESIHIKGTNLSLAVILTHIASSLAARAKIYLYICIYVYNVTRKPVSSSIIWFARSWLVQRDGVSKVSSSLANWPRAWIRDVCMRILPVICVFRVSSAS